MDQNEAVENSEMEIAEGLAYSWKRVESAKNTALVELNGWLNIPNSRLLFDRIEQLIDKGYLWLIFDLRNLTYIIEEGGVFTQILKRVKSLGGNAALVFVSERILHVWEALGFAKYYNICGSMSDALVEVKHLDYGDSKLGS